MSGRNKVALVTGAGSGIGAAAAEGLAHAGYTVVLAGRRQERLDEVAARISVTGEDTLVVPTDVSNSADVANLFSTIAEQLGRLDLLFNNAGRRVPSKLIEDVTMDEWQAAIDTNLTGAFLCTQHAVRLMKTQVPSGGRIINNGSLSAHVPRPHSVAYTATKHAISGLTKATSLDCRSSGICCGQIDIGNAATEMTARLEQGVLQADGTTVPEPRMDVVHVAEAVVYMAGLPLDANVQSLTVMANSMPFVGRG